MSETAAHLVDEVLPAKPIRQWVLSFPFQIRLCLAVRPKIMARALKITHLSVAKYYRKKSKLSKSNSKTGAVTLIQRFGGSLNAATCETVQFHMPWPLNVHFHQLFIDGSYELSDDGAPISFWASEAPTTKELEEVLAEIIKRITRYLERQQIITKDNEANFRASRSKKKIRSRVFRQVL